MLNIFVKRCDGRVFYFDELTAATVTPQVNYTEVNAGWSLYPVAYLPGQSTFEMSITSGKFEADLFVMANATKFIENDNYSMMVTEVLTPNAYNEVLLAHTPETGSISIAYPYHATNNPRGMMVETSTTPAAGTFKVSQDNDVTKLTFAEGDITDTVTVSYSYIEQDVQEAMIDNRSSAIGEALMKYPVYGSGDDCSDAAIIGYAYVHVFRCRVTAAPGFDASYKTAGTYQFTLGAMDPKRPDDMVYSIAFKRN